MKSMKWIAGAVGLGMAMLPASAAWSGEEHMHAGHDHSQHMQQAPRTPAAAPQGTALRLPDTVLTDQNGRQLRLLSDVVGDKVVVVSFVYTNCTTVCPVVSHLFSELQEKLGGLLEDRVRLVTLTVDPARDTPNRLKSYSAKHGARPGWLWLTGSSANVTAALKGFGTYTANFENHPSVILIGDGRTGKWTRYYGFEDPERLIGKTYEFLAVRDRNQLASAFQE